MFLFRWYRETLADSMNTVISFLSYEELLTHVRCALHEQNPAINQLTFEHGGMDDRIGWDTWYVCVDGKCIGMSNCNPKKKEYKE